MKTSVLKKTARPTHQTRTQSTEDYWTDALRISELPARAESRNDSDSHLAALKLANVRPLYEQPSDFDEAAFRHVRQNFQRLVHFFNELADRTGQSPLQLESSPEPSVATFINHDWRGPDSPEGEYPENKDYDHN